MTPGQEILKVNGRRDNGEGTKIKKVPGKNLYRTSIRLKDADGTRRRRDFYGPTKKEIRNKLRDAKPQAERGILPTTETVAEYLTRWYPRGDIRPRTVYARRVCANRMIRFIGELKLQDLRAGHIQNMYEGLSEGLSDHSVKQVHSVLRKALKDAVKEGTLPDNPIDRLISTPSVKSKEMQTLTPEERDKLLALNDEWTPLFTLLSITGLRIGEALGLAWSSVDLEKGSLVVRRTAGRVPGEGLQYGEPKTPESHRRIPLEQRVVTALRVQKLRSSNGSGDLVFPNEACELMEPTRANRALATALKRIAVTRHIRVHDLRHTAGSLMHQNGASAKEIKEIMGHANIQTTMDIYVHTNEQMLREAMERGAKPYTPSEALGVRG